MVLANANRLVAVRVPFGPAFPDAVEGVWAVGDAVLPLHPGLPDAEVAALLAAFRPASLLTGPGAARDLPDAVGVAPGTALVVPTSGTTGAAKGVELTHDNLVASALSSAARIGQEAGDRWLCCVPPSHIAGLMVLVRSRLAGCVPIVLPRFDVEAIRADRTATLISLVPTMLRRLLAEGVDVARFRCILLGGGAIPADLVAEANRRGARVVTTYGMTETCGGVVYDGVALPGASVAVAEDGEIRISGPMVTGGYRLRPDLTAERLRDGWFHTADAGEWGPGGALAVLGRRDDLIITGGEKVAPAEVEGVLAAHPLVGEVVVTGRADAEWGQAVVAIVVAAGARRAPTLADLRAFASQRLAGFKAPKALLVVPELPRGPTGKPVGLAELAARALPPPTDGTPGFPDLAAGS